MRGYGDCCDSGSDVENGVTPIKTRLLRKGQSSGSDTMLEILKDCIVFHNQRIYISAFIQEAYVCGTSKHMCAVQVKCSTNTNVLYK